MMNWKLAFSIAVTHLLTKKRQSLVAMMGVVFGISMFIVMISFMTGVNKFIEDMAMDGSPHIRVYNPLEIRKDNIISLVTKDTTIWAVVHHKRPKNELPKIKNGIQLAAKLEEVPGIEGVAPQIASQVFFNNGPIQISGTINGINVKKQQELFNLESKMDEGSLKDLLQTKDAIVLGLGLAKKVNVAVGDRISITTPSGSNLLLKVVGTFSYGIATFDDTKSYSTISTVQKVLQKNQSYITDLHIKLSDYTRAKAIGKQLAKQYNIYTEDWETSNASMLAGDKIRNTMTTVVSFTLLLVAGFGIYNIMNMNIINKMKDIAILKATGFQGKDIISIFLMQSLMIGVLGGIVGVAMGYGFSYLLSITPFPEGTFFRIKTMPVNFNPLFYVFGVVFGFITTLFAGYFPALRASKIDPVAIIRG